MKVNIFLFIISLVICGLIFFGLYNWVEDTQYLLLYTLGTALMSFIFLATATSVTVKDAPRLGVMIKVVSALFLITIFVVDLIFMSKQVSSTTFIVTNGIMLCIWAIIVYGIARVKANPKIEKS